MSVAENIDNIKKGIDTLNDNVLMVAVSKSFSVSDILQAYNHGQRDFGENYVQELVEKQKELNKFVDINWHFIGHLQTNKVKYIAPFINWIQCVDSIRLASEIDKQAKKHNRIIKCLIQINISEEESKSGINTSSLYELIEFIMGLENLKLKGIMSIPTPFLNDSNETINEFKLMKELSSDLQEKYPQMTELSMGMSSDYRIAIEHGATIVRIGSLIFGDRIYEV